MTLIRNDNGHLTCLACRTELDEAQLPATYIEKDHFVVCKMCKVSIEEGVHEQIQ